eukprot:CAMPEP_0115872074 /NCGR_PEP_ID=MMETSP0287-20121206/23228_1 /TAXON_ID=412157 /ORGANISM="Chrysochromulina rotalis, Strain UIO044" /LENGTH=79 /DNA_ID=CAMNT_0003326963 /DNA_START=419 /DNA_END=656 /DNA_ORIENTATION=+
MNPLSACTLGLHCGENMPDLIPTVLGCPQLSIGAPSTLHALPPPAAQSLALSTAASASASQRSGSPAAAAAAAAARICS